MKKYILYSDAELMQKIKADDMFAFDALYKKYSKKLFQFAFSIIKSKEETENILQEVFLKLWENRNSVEKDASVKSYIFSIAYNSSITSIRKKIKEIQFIEYLKSLQKIHKEDEDSVNVKFEFKELTTQLHNIVNQLPDRQKEVYLLHREFGLKSRDIAEKLNISVNTIENHMSRALKTIRNKLREYSMF